MINKMVGSKAVGLYSIAYQISMIYLFIIMGINQAWVPLFYEKMKNKEYVNIDNVLKRYSIFISILAVGFVIISPYLVKLLTTSDYLKAINVLPVIVIGFMFQYLYVQLVNYSFYEKKTLNIAIFSLLAASVNVALNYFLIPKFGYVAAAWTTVVSYVLLFLLHYINVKFILRVYNTVSLKKLITPVLIAVFVLGMYIMILNNN
jgi:O-antigen/teichoic acid export membrane protein